MKYVQTLGLLAVAAAALLAFVGNASATTLTSPPGTAYTGVIEETATHVVIHGSFVSATCTHSKTVWKVEVHGKDASGKTQPASGKIISASVSGCSYPVTVLKAGSVQVSGTGSGNGTVYSSGAEIKIHTSVGECIFTTSNTHFGTLTGGTPAKRDIGSAVVPRTGGSFFCGSTGTWTGNYTITSPSSLSVH